MKDITFTRSKPIRKDDQEYVQYFLTSSITGNMWIQVNTSLVNISTSVLTSDRYSKCGVLNTGTGNSKSMLISSQRATFTDKATLKQHIMAVLAKVPDKIATKTNDDDAETNDDQIAVDVDNATQAASGTTSGSGSATVKGNPSTIKSRAALWARLHELTCEAEKHIEQCTQSVHARLPSLKREHL